MREELSDKDHDFLIGVIIELLNERADMKYHGGLNVERFVAQVRLLCTAEFAVSAGSGGRGAAAEMGLAAKRVAALAMRIATECEPTTILICETELDAALANAAGFNARVVR
jgi:hypothetical protein